MLWKTLLYHYARDFIEKMFQAKLQAADLTLHGQALVKQHCDPQSGITGWVSDESRPILYRMGGSRFSWIR